ncbi:M20/M25/M40 family metallo-hydrolase [Rubripirellula lacrimiformis]|nr:M20/M25/M40 family metallo-hydrolase [Rubripirellula lacrimiformis]
MSNPRLTEILLDLIRFPTVSALSNADISDRVAELLTDRGFTVEVTSYDDAAGVRKVNLVAKRDPKRPGGGPHSSSIKPASGGLAYFCHTDVVPAVAWTGPGGDPFAGVVAEDRIFGRGACDMKGSLVSMLGAIDEVDVHQQTAPIWVVCTADEEVGFEGAAYLVKHSQAYREIVAAQPLAIIGEPTRLRVVHAHKGILGLSILSQGRAAHSSTDGGINANEAIVPVLATLLEIAQQTRADASLHDERFDPPHLSWNFGVSDGCTAVNITPGRSTAWCSLRPMPRIDGEALIKRVVDQAEANGLSVRRMRGGRPVWIDPQSPCIVDMCRLAGGPPITVCYGTDGGEFFELNQRVVLGPGDIAQAHTTDEYILLEQFNRGPVLYAEAIRHWCTG